MSTYCAHNLIFVLLLCMADTTLKLLWIFQGAAVPLDEGLVGMVASTGRSIALDDPPAHANFSSVVDEQPGMLGKIVRSPCLPLIARIRVALDCLVTLSPYHRGAVSRKTTTGAYCSPSFLVCVLILVRWIYVCRSPDPQPHVLPSHRRPAQRGRGVPSHQQATYHAYRTRWPFIRYTLSAVRGCTGVAPPRRFRSASVPRRAVRRIRRKAAWQPSSHHRGGEWRPYMMCGGLMCDIYGEVYHWARAGEAAKAQLILGMGADPGMLCCAGVTKNQAVFGFQERSDQQLRDACVDEGPGGRGGRRQYRTAAGGWLAAHAGQRHGQHIPM